MGEFAEDMIDGSCCSLCGQYFVKINEGETEIKADENGLVNNAQIFSHGYPVYCKGCWTPDCGHQKATAETI